MGASPLALQPDDLDLDFAPRTIWVRRNGYRRQVTTPKSNRTRKVDMSQQPPGLAGLVGCRCEPRQGKLLVFAAQPSGCTARVARSTASHAALVKITVRNGRLWSYAARWAAVGAPKM